jgi:hypothetical protein
MSHNPYAAPAATLDHTASTTVALYSPAQAATGAFLGGPVGLIYFLRQNFLTLGNKSAARTCLILGALLIAIILIVLPFLPAKFPSSPITLVYIVIARYVAEKYQATKQAITESPEYTFQSNWTVFGMGLLCLLASVMVIIGPYLALHALGLAA